MVGIVGYGAYVPKYRIRVEEIAKQWGEDTNAIKGGLGVKQKSVPNLDEDTITIAVQAAKNAVAHANINPKEIGAVYVGSESHPYAVKPSSTVVAEAINAVPEMTAADLEFACKAGTAAIQICMGMVSSDMIKYGLAIGSDTSQGKPGDALEYTAAAGGGAYIIGKENVVAEIIDTYSFTTDTPDFWRREGESYPRHGGRFTGKPAYFRHIINATKGLIKKTGVNIDDVDYVVLHQPNAKFPLRAAKMMGIPKEKVLPGLLCPEIGNCYSGSVPVGLANVLDQAKSEKTILVTAFGSGAGSDSFLIKTTKLLEKNRKRSTPLSNYLKDTVQLDYGQYLKHREKIKM